MEYYHKKVYNKNTIWEHEFRFRLESDFDYSLNFSLELFMLKWIMGTKCEKTFEMNK